MVLDQVSEQDPVDARAVKILARYLAAGAESEKKNDALASLAQIVSEHKKNRMVALMAATIYMHEQKYEDALSILHSRASLEAMALNVQCYLSIFRTDLAQKEVQAMIAINEDATITQLSIARVNLMLGGAKCQEAYFIFQEMCEKYSQTVLLLNGLSACQMLQNNFGEASILLKQALDKNPTDPMTLLNVICCDQHTSKGADHFSVYMKQLKSSASSSALLSIDALDASFDSNARRYTPSK
jgi:coatomer subunit epsilon